MHFHKQFTLNRCFRGVYYCRFIEDYTKFSENIETSQIVQNASNGILLKQL